MRKPYILYLLMIFVTACGDNANKDDQDISPADTIITDEETQVGSEMELREFSDKIMLLIKEKNWEQLSEYVHPEKGVLFSPYGFIDTGTAVVMGNETLATVAQNKQPQEWGTQHGSGMPIELPFFEYYDQYIYDQDYLNADSVALNKVVKEGNTVVNIKEIFPQAKFVSYHFKGFDHKFEGMDWKSLRLVFEPYENEWKLVAIVHDQWTI